MTTIETDEKKLWNQVTDLLGDERISLSPQLSQSLFADPLAFSKILAKYKFCSKMIGPGKSILELECLEGIGSTILSKNSHQYLGIESSEEHFAYAKKNWSSESRSFIFHEAALDKNSFDAITCIHPIKSFKRLFSLIKTHLKMTGLIIIALPKHPSLLDELEKTFHNILPFHMHGTSILSGLSENFNEDVLIGCYKK